MSVIFGAQCVARLDDLQLWCGESTTHAEYDGDGVTVIGVFCEAHAPASAPSIPRLAPRAAVSTFWLERGAAVYAAQVDPAVRAHKQELVTERQRRARR